jgi:sulfite exporter TauE/SafE
MDAIALYISAAGIALLHTILGPDHYLPFIVIAKARKWSKVRTFWITLICGIGHVGSSVILGIVGIALGIALNKLVHIESFRGEIAAWVLIVFGFLYFLWGMWQSRKNVHKHITNNPHLHLHDEEDVQNINITPWVLFIIFVLGPCEPLIPLFIYPAAQHHWSVVFMVTLIFSGITILTMLALTFAGVLGLNQLPMKKLERYMHALAGFVIFLCGISIQFLGL